MADLTSLSIIGDWRIVIQSNNAGWAQRVVVKGTAAGDVVIDGTVGGSRDVFGNGTAPWQLTVQHNDGVNGWQDNWVRLAASSIGPGTITQTVQSEDVTTPASDRDFDDLVVRLEKLGMVDQPARPFAVLPGTMQMMPDGIFETALGRYFMGVRVRNVWTRPWPAGARVGLTPRSRAWLQAAGVRVIDGWSSDDTQVFGQDVAGGRILAEGLAPWATKTVYFKVDVTDAKPRKHLVEVQVNEPVSHVHPKARAPMLVTRTAFDAVKRVFVSECDRGRLTASVRELAVDYNTLKRAISRARELFKGGSTGGGGSGGTDGATGCADVERLRRELIDLLNGKPGDLCDLWRRIQCCCGYGGGRPSGGGDDGPWTGSGGTGLEILCVPTLVDYRVDYASPFAGQFGPIPFDDPWWKVVLAIIAVVLALGAVGSSVADLANRSNDVVIGEVTRSVLNAIRSPAAPDVTTIKPTDPGSVDAAVVKLNGNRGQTSAIFTYLDAATGEENVLPLVELDGQIDTTGTTLTNAQITQIWQNLSSNPSDPAAQDAARVFKSGARTGLTRAIITGCPPIASRTVEGGGEIFFINQVRLGPDPAAPTTIARPGDSGSLWLQLGTNAVVGLNHAGCSAGNFATMCRIQDVMDALKIRFS